MQRKAKFDDWIWKFRAYMAEILIKYALKIAPKDYQTSIDLAYDEGYNNGYKDQWRA